MLVRGVMGVAEFYNVAYPSIVELTMRLLTGDLRPGMS